MTPYISATLFASFVRIIGVPFISAVLDEEMPDFETDFEYNFSMIPVAAGILYGVGIGLPLLIKFLINLYGSTDNTTPVVTSIGIYGYSFSSFLITSLLCAIPIEWLQWLLILYSAVTALGLITKSYWDDLESSLP